MSSTNRGAQRMELDYYKTPASEIVKFVNAFRFVLYDEGNAFPQRILDPCAGGNKTRMEFPRKDRKGKDKKPIIFEPSLPAYPEAFKQIPDWRFDVCTLDIREDSEAQYPGIDFLTSPAPLQGVALFDAVITNPPFSLAHKFVTTAMDYVREGGYVAMLLRSAFVESDDRSTFMQAFKPEFAFKHTKRMGFYGNSETDSCPYEHFVWRIGHNPVFTKTFYLPWK